jgi:methylated-DNA-[protein]-cysteine S-methyltransferase
MKFFRTFLPSPVGKLILIAEADALVSVLWQKDRPDRVVIPGDITDEENDILSQTAVQLNEYFNKQRNRFTIPIKFYGTDFQKQVWKLLQAIPYGETRSYGQLAKLLGDTGASRAVGAANGRNPVSIIVPCHRVIGSNGSLTGFAGGMEAKKYLLDLEANLLL